MVGIDLASSTSKQTGSQHPPKHVMDWTWLQIGGTSCIKWCLEAEQASPFETSCSRRQPSCHGSVVHHTSFFSLLRIVCWLQARFNWITPVSSWPHKGREDCCHQWWVVSASILLWNLPSSGHTVLLSSWSWCSWPGLDGSGHDNNCSKLQLE